MTHFYSFVLLFFMKSNYQLLINGILDHLSSFYCIRMYRVNDHKYKLERSLCNLCWCLFYPWHFSYYVRPQFIRSFRLSTRFLLQHIEKIEFMILWIFIIFQREKSQWSVHCYECILLTPTPSTHCTVYTDVIRRSL